MASSKNKVGYLVWGATAIVSFTLVELTLWQKLGDDEKERDMRSQLYAPGRRMTGHIEPLRHDANADGMAIVALQGHVSRDVEKPLHATPAPTGARSALQVPTKALGVERLQAVKAAERSRQLPKSRARRRVGGPDPIPPLSEPNRSTPIVVELSAFLDGDRCGRTIARALEQASEPGRLTFHVVQARDKEHDDCIDVFKTQYLRKLCQGKLADGQKEDECKRRVLATIRAWVIHPSAGKGPVHQRGVANELLRYDRDDSLCLSMDSHMHFQPGWDTTLTDDWASTRNEFAVLTAYPADVRELTHYQWLIDLCGYDLEGIIPRGRGGINVPIDGSAPYLTMNWAAGMSFHRCHMERIVPVDRHMTWIFTGEEISRAVRAWTHGYDLYLPTNLAVLHEYKHASQRFHFYGDAKEKSAGEQHSRERLSKLFQTDAEPARKVKDKLRGSGAKAATGDDEFHEFGLGTQRTLEDYVTWSRTNLGGRWGRFLKEKGLGTTPPGAGFCRGLKRRPVADEAKMVAMVEALEHTTAWKHPPKKNDKGEVEIPGEGADVRPVQVL